MTIQWFPGHMAKAKREVAEKLKLVDFVIELVDARAPRSSQNPMLQSILQEKPKLIVLMKKDLADSQVTNEWIEHFKNEGIPAVAIEANQKQDVQKVVQKAKELGKEKIEKLKAKGIRPRASRAMIIGIPNVGKSTLINRLANKKMAKTGDKPGVTTKQQWIKVKKEFELLDTPGILWPKFEEEEVGYRLASIGTIKDQILPKEDVAAYVLDFLNHTYPDLLEERFGLQNVDDIMEVFESIGKKRGCLESGGQVNFDKVADIILQDLRTGKLGSISLERPDS
ncbi:ribosome biogenesis GTPase YlqF [Halobacillus karajensis]|uniref:Ribosome biogenesis GTPase A n=1 Tax=Halobacillus karajensis TaxID=195088 RepID=A0A024P2C9_9BACI|nr:ribosome biogenesis GTPase YlqF [Halobacillus karajensis]CDQ19758.1 Ribosome biogenesis GTPase A [Halobacillus karajensis]CDQ22218.1 Ribosome biogenesis GTPase A [Halobacillus karajensis]CDQ28059.1 Ribosome biogenesis GTPase A [Halobacillus karajensis]